MTLVGKSICCAQMDLAWKEIKESDGLLSNYTYCMVPMDDGSLWIGTENGVSVYDGFRAQRVFSAKDTSMFETPTYFMHRSGNHLWMATRNGVKIYDLKLKQLVNAKIGENRITEDIYFLNGKKVLITYYLGFYEVDLDDHGLPIKVVDHPLTNLVEEGNAIVNEFFLDSKDQLYISIAGYGVIRGPIDSLSQWPSFPLLNIPFKTEQYGFKRCLSIIQKNDNHLLLTFIEAGIFELDINTEQLSPFGGMTLFDSEFSVVIAASMSGDYLITGQFGLGLVHGEISSFEQSKQLYDFSSLPDFNPWDNQITSVKIFGSTVWVSTLGDGIKYAQLNSNLIRWLPLDQYVNKNMAIYSVKADAEDQLWIGSNGDGLFKAELGEHGFKQVIPFNVENDLMGLPSDSINEIHFAQNGSLWIATSKGVANYSNASEITEKLAQGRAVQPKIIMHDPTDSTSISSNMIHDLFEDEGGNMYMTSLAGLNIINTKGTVLNYQNHSDIPYLKDGRTIYYGDFLSDSSLVLNGPWVNTIYQRNELMNYNDIFPMDKTLYVQHVGHGESFDWIGTTRGLFKYDPKLGSVVHFEGQDYFKSFKLNAVAVSGETVWMGTNQGLYSYHITTNEIMSYPLSTGSGSPYFNLGSVAKNSKGQVFFGTSGGIVMVDAKKIKEEDTKCVKTCQIYISSALLNQKRIEWHHQGDEVKWNPVEIEKEDLLELSLGFPIFHIRDEVRIQYTLDGKQWLETARHLPKIVLHQLSPDHYDLQVRALSKEGKLMSVVTIPLDVIFPWYARWWAYTLYVTVIGLVVFTFIKLKLNRVRQIQRRELEHTDLRQRQEVNDLKFEFISNISHELRTPLTLLLNEISRLKSDVAASEISPKIKQHAERLKRLANEMLDLKGIGNEELKLTVGEYDIVSFARDKLGLFEETAAKCGIILSFSSAKESMMLWFNPHQFEKVIFNLLTNAIKFTPEGGEVKLSISEGKEELKHEKLNGKVDHIRLEVSDTGFGIAEEDLSKLFFSDYSSAHQEETEFDSAGIGLYLCQKIVDLHYGDITVKSEVEKGSNFTVRIPQDHFHYDDDQLERIKSEMTPSAHYMMKTTSSTHTNTPTNIPVVLTVDDNPEIIKIYRQLFADHFKHHIATNGVEGVEKAKSVVPDIIITDLSMPGKSGIALIHAIKKDEYLSHIPIIVLTSYASDEQRINILNQGADAFITKPFDSEVLLASVRNLLNSRSVLKDMFSDKAVNFGDLVRQSPDSDLLKRIISVVEKNMTDPDFDVAMLADQLKMSRSLLYLKLSNLTNYSPKEFIHIMRVRKGAKLLKSGTFRVKEVSYYVGYNSQKNFRKYFKGYHGVAPSDYVRHKA